jgi:hypothetical protein
LWDKKDYVSLVEGEKRRGTDLGIDIEHVHPIPAGFKLIPDNIEDKKKGRARLAKGMNVKLRYVIDLDGKSIEGLEVKLAFELVMKLIKVKWACRGPVPARWSDVPDAMKTELFNLLRIRILAFRYCLHNWKAEEMMKDKYPSIMQTVRRQSEPAAKKQCTGSPEVCAYFPTRQST